MQNLYCANAKSRRMAALFRQASRSGWLYGSSRLGRPWTALRTQRTAAAAAVPEVYTMPPPQPLVEKPGQLSHADVQQYFDKGHVLVPKFFTQDEMQPVMEAVEECVDIIANRLYKAGKIWDKCENAGFYQRMWMLEHQFRGAVIMLIKMGSLPPGFRQLWSNQRLLNVVEQFIGPNIAGHPVWNLRTKTPHNEQTTVPWHQDNAYLDPQALNVLQVTAWIPLLDTNQENGCMQIVSGGHRRGMTATHTCCAGGTWYVDLEEEVMERELGVDLKRDVVTCPVPLGGVLFLNNCVPHRSLENHSDKVRWSLDLRWQNPNMPNGFYELKDNVLMRKEGDPSYEIDWSSFANVDRNQLQEKDVGYDGDDFDTTIHGPWMKRWEIVHHNKHTNALTSGSSHKA